VIGRGDQVAVYDESLAVIGQCSKLFLVLEDAKLSREKQDG